MANARPEVYEDLPGNAELLTVVHLGRPAIGGGERLTVGLNREYVSAVDGPLTALGSNLVFLTGFYGGSLKAGVPLDHPIWSFETEAVYGVALRLTGACWYTQGFGTIFSQWNGMVIAVHTPGDVSRHAISPVFNHNRLSRDWCGYLGP